MDFQILRCFASGAAFVGNVAAFLIGAALVLLLVAAGLLLFAALAGWLFDRATAWISSRWTAKGVKPKGRIAQVILSHGVRDG